MGNKESQIRTQSSLQPSSVTKFISIKQDPITGKFKGVPKEWATLLNTDENYIVETSQLPKEVRTFQIPETSVNFSEIIPKQKCKSMREILQVDRNSPLGLNGLNEQIQKEIFSSGIGRNEILVNSDNFISILEIFDGKELAFKQDFKEQSQIDFTIENPASNYIFTQQIGKGQICKLYKIIDRKTNKKYVSKVIKFYDHFNVHQLKREIVKTISLACPNIVKYIDTYLHSGFLFVVMEYMNFGNLNDLIQQFRHQLTESMMAYILHQILLTIKLLHYKGHVHGNINSRKILLNSKGEVKILTMNYHEQLVNRMKPYWMAPEIIESQTLTESADIWSIAIIAYELSEGNPPYFDQHPIKVMYNVFNNSPPTINNKRSEEFQAFAKLCLTKNYANRATLKDLVKCDFIQKNKDKGMKKLIDLLDQNRESESKKYKIIKSKT